MGEFSRAKAQSLLEASRVLEVSAATFERDTVVLGVGFEVQSETGRRGELAVSPGALRKIAFPSKGQPVFANLRRDSDLLNALSQLGLEAPKCLVDQINLKVPRRGTGFRRRSPGRAVRRSPRRDSFSSACCRSPLRASTPRASTRPIATATSASSSGGWRAGGTARAGCCSRSAR